MLPTHAARPTITEPAQVDESQRLPPNGSTSNLPEDLWHFVRTPAFKAWFGDWESAPEEASKVVDENGEPQLVYHGTSRDFETFDTDITKRLSRTNSEIPGLFFTDSELVASSYGPRIIPAFLNLRAPYVNEGSNSWKEMTLSNGRVLTAAPPIAQQGYLIVAPDEIPVDGVVEHEVDGGRYVNVRVSYPTLACIDQVVDWAAASGFDGIIARDISDMGRDVGKRLRSTTVVALDPSQTMALHVRRPGA